MSSPDGIRRVEPAQLRPTAQALAALLAVDARRLGVLPLAVDDTRIVLAFSTAPSGSVVAEIAMATAKNVVPVLADRGALADAIGLAYPGRDRQSGAHPHRRAARPPARCRAVRTSTSPRERRRAFASTARCDRSTGYDVLDGETIEQLVFPVIDEDRRRSFLADLELDVAYSMPGRSRFRMNVFRQRGSVGAVLRAIPFKIPDFDTLGLPPIVKTLRRAAARPGARHRPDRVGQVDDAGLAARHHQPHQGRPHHLVRGSDRVPPLAQEGDRQSARGRPGHPLVRLGVEAGPARGPRRDPRRRDARSRDDPHGADRGGDRTPRLRHAAHTVRPADRRPHRRRLPARAARTDPGHAGDDAAGRRHAAARDHRQRQRDGPWPPRCSSPHRPCET